MLEFIEEGKFDWSVGLSEYSLCVPPKFSVWHQLSINEFMLIYLSWGYVPLLSAAT